MDVLVLKKSIMPTVFAVKDMYQIFIPLDFEAVIMINVDGEMYYDDANGILRSNSFLHKVEIPMRDLDAAKKYTVICRKMIERKPYFPTSEEPFEVEFNFKPVKKGEINIYHISDAHNLEEQPIAAGMYFGDKLDLLILNGDIPNHSGEIENFNSIYRIAFGITKGEIPVVFSKGNHDTRGIHAEEFSQYTPTDSGKPYYTFRLGGLWGLILDCGEDKPDSHEEYGNTICFHNYRLKETQFIKNVIENAGGEYGDDGVEHKIVICHIPFIKQFNPPFNIEEDLYRDWTKMVCENIKPELLIFGHTHKICIHEPKGEFDYYGYQSCTAVVGSAPNMKARTFIGCGITLGDHKPQIIFNDEKLNKVIC